MRHLKIIKTFLPRGDPRQCFPEPRHGTWRPWFHVAGPPREKSVRRPEELRQSVMA